jgi:hypothetical protein
MGNLQSFVVVWDAASSPVSSSPAAISINAGASVVQPASMKQFRTYGGPHTIGKYSAAVFAKESDAKNFISQTEPITNSLQQTIKDLRSWKEGLVGWAASAFFAPTRSQKEKSRLEAEFKKAEAAIVSCAKKNSGKITHLESFARLETGVVYGKELRIFGIEQVMAQAQTPLKH